MAPFVYATNEEMKINVTHGWFLWRLLKYSQIAFVHAFQANAVFIPELGNLGFNWLIWCMYFQQIMYVLGVHLQYKGQGLLECFSPVWRPDWKAEDNRWWNPFYRAGHVKRTAWSVTCLRVGCAGEQSLAYGSAHTSVQEFWIFACGECSSLIFFTSGRTIPDVCGLSSSEVGNAQTMVAHPGCSFIKIAWIWCWWKSDVPTLSQRVMCQAFSSINLPMPIIKSVSIWLSLAIKQQQKK